MILLEEGGERKSASNINYLLEEFGVSINNGKEWVEGGGGLKASIEWESGTNGN